jgi:hypothetical protein
MEIGVGVIARLVAHKRAGRDAGGTRDAVLRLLSRARVYLQQFFVGVEFAVFA